MGQMVDVEPSLDYFQVKL